MYQLSDADLIQLDKELAPLYQDQTAHDFFWYNTLLACIQHFIPLMPDKNLQPAASSQQIILDVLDQYIKWKHSPSSLC